MIYSYDIEWSAWWQCAISQRHLVAEWVSIEGYLFRFDGSCIRLLIRHGRRPVAQRLPTNAVRQIAYRPSLSLFELTELPATKDAFDRRPTLSWQPQTILDIFEVRFITLPALADTTIVHYRDKEVWEQVGCSSAELRFSAGDTRTCCPDGFSQGARTPSNPGFTHSMVRLQ